MQACVRGADDSAGCLSHLPNRHSRCAGHEAGAHTSACAKLLPDDGGHATLNVATGCAPGCRKAWWVARSADEPDAGTPADPERSSTATWAHAPREPCSRLHVPRDLSTWTRPAACSRPVHRRCAMLSCDPLHQKGEALQDFPQSRLLSPHHTLPASGRRDVSHIQQTPWPVSGGADESTPVHVHMALSAPPLNPQPSSVRPE